MAVFGSHTQELESEYRDKKIYIEPSQPVIAAEALENYMTKPQLEKTIEKTRKQMQEAAKKLEFIQAAQYRDELIKLEDLIKERFG